MASSNERTLTLLLALSGAFASSGCVVTINDGDTDGESETGATTDTGSETASGTSESGDGDAGDGDAGDGDAGTGDGDAGDGDGGTTAGDGDGDGDSPCQAFAEAYVPCAGKDTTVELEVAECEDYIEAGYLYGDACGEALADFYACLSLLDCAGFENVNSCATELDDYELACGEAGDGDTGGDGDSGTSG